MKVAFNGDHYPMLDFFFDNEGKEDYMKDRELLLTVEQWDLLECSLENAYIEIESGSNYFKGIDEAKCAYYQSMKNEIL